VWGGVVEVVRAGTDRFFACKSRKPLAFARYRVLEFDAGLVPHLGGTAARIPRPESFAVVPYDPATAPPNGFRWAADDVDGRGLTRGSQALLMAANLTAFACFA